MYFHINIRLKGPNKAKKDVFVTELMCDGKVCVFVATG